jgi:hypothetical protein
MDTTSTFKGTGFEVFELFVGHKAFLLNPLLLPPPYSRKRSIDEPLVNQSFASLDHLEEVLAQRCCILHDMQAQIAALANSGLTQADPPTPLKRGLSSSPLFKGG